MHDFALRESTQQLLNPLYPSITQLAYLLAFIYVPFFVMEFFIETFYGLRGQKVNERESKVEPVLEVDRKVKEIE